MRYATIVGGLVCALVLCALPGVAQSIPPGSYQQTCTDMSVYGSALSARCQDKNGAWRSTRLSDFQNCSEIVNDNGSLRCSKSRYQGNGFVQGGYGQGYPRGDYVQTCRDIRADGNRLDAECQRRDGSWRRTSLDDMSRCRGSIINNDGNLMCGSSGNPSSDYRREWRNGLPPGNYIETCRNAQLDGDRLTAECEKRNGKWRKTSLDDINRCSDAIANDNGHLVCPKDPNRYGYYNNNGNQGGYQGGNQGGYQGGIPSGTYTQSCRNMRMNGNTLEAECQARDGDWHRTSLSDVNRCPSPPANDDGHLVCGR